MAYTASLAVVFALGMLSEWMSAMARAGQPLHGAADELARICDDAPRRSKPPALADGLREGALHAASVALNLAVMLLAMSYNVGIFAAVVCGVAFARTIMARAEMPAGRRSIELCH
jgi:hypothetical protein